MPPECPWEQLRQSAFDFCETPLCDWVKQPGNTWSNVGFVAVGLWILVRERRERGSLLRLVGIAAVATGIGSTFYHASGTYVGSLADYAGMFLGTGTMTALNVRRWKRWSRPACVGVFVLTSGTLVALMLVFPYSPRWLYLIAMPCCAIECLLYFRDGRRISYRDYQRAWHAAGLGLVVWTLDVTRLLCEPDNHVLPAHAAWHLLMALTLFFFYRFYRQFPDVRGAFAPPTYDCARVP